MNIRDYCHTLTSFTLYRNADISQVKINNFIFYTNYFARKLAIYLHSLSSHNLLVVMPVQSTNTMYYGRKLWL